MRTRLENRRQGLTIDVSDPNPNIQLRYEVMVGFDGGISPGEVREVFVSCNKTTTAMDIAGRDIGTLISIALQCGARVEELAGAVCRDDQGKPQGIAGAVLDAIKDVSWSRQ